ncbi:sarcoplasmic calcium-binding protein [Lingula anatina]|uniref:Sarcoplasmic calcium-binding protein n=1 Tax=Lingula anatina TaxID=7574 RepID=A0A1S3KD43_LINAN|nr:sarcoplasmic calcium-binding protein [Lingula anatina]|eukprot:XP_013420374.1 sarcoplasmic calcium-binding protein [Lingula anatina]
MADQALPPYPEFWVRKMRSFFILFDRDGDGIIHKSDYVDTVLNRAKKWMNEQQIKVFYELLDGGWETFMKTETPKDTRTFEDMLHARYFMDFDANMEKNARDWLGTYFDGVADANGDGHVTLKEYTHFLGSFGVHPFSVTPSFQAIDIDGSGLITRDEFIETGTKFLSVMVDTSAKLFWGPFTA